MSKDQKEMMIFIIIALALLFAGVVLGNVGSMALDPWRLATVLALLSYFFYCVLKPLWETPVCISREPMGVMANATGAFLGCLPVMLGAIVLWLGAVVGVWIQDRFISALIISIVWPALTLLAIRIEIAIRTRQR